MIGIDQPHHDGSTLYVSDAAPALGDTVTVRLRVPAAHAGAKAMLRTNHDGEGTFTPCTLESETATESWWTAELPVRSPVSRYRFLVHGGPTALWVNGRGAHDWDPTDAQDFRIVARPPAPKWIADAAFYQVFPDRFAASASQNHWPSWAKPAAWGDPVAETGHDAMVQLYGGDLDGIASKLDHIASVGATALYLTPIFAAESNHRYNATTFDSVDPVLGGDAALARLADEVHRRGMHLIGDLTTNHTGSGHDWFTAAQADAASAEAGFFLFEEHPDRYEAWFDVPSLPKLDHRDPELRRRFYEGDSSVVAKWLKEPWALDGWRIDVANMTGRHREVDLNGEVAATIRATMRSVNPETYLLAEHMHDHTADLDGSGWDGAMNYSGFQRPVLGFLNPGHWRPVTGRSALRTMHEFLASVPWRSAAANLNLLGSHDTPRIASLISDREARRVALGLLSTWVGVPSIFAGDELGVPGSTTHSARQPMPWDERAWDTDTLDTHRRLLKVRRDSSAIRHGGLRPVQAGEDTITFLRESVDQRVLVHAARRSHEPVRLNAAALGLSAPATSLVGGDELAVGVGGLVALPADGPSFHVWDLTST